MRKRYSKIIISMSSARKAVAFLLSLHFLLSGSPVGFAQAVEQSRKPKSNLALPGEKCRVEPLLEWSSPERWAWACICEGKKADFNEYLGEKIDPIDPHEWSYDNRFSTAYKWMDGRRTLSSRFLRTILLYEPFRNAIPHHGIRISGAYFSEPINLDDAFIDMKLELIHSRFESEVNMNHFVTKRLISFDGSKFNSTLKLNSALIKNHLFIRENAEIDEVYLKGTKIEGQFTIFDSKINLLNMESIIIKDNLQLMSNSKIDEIDLKGAKIEGQFTISDSKINLLNMESMMIKGDLLIQNAQFNKKQLNEEQFNEVNFKRLEVDGQIMISNSTFEVGFNMNSASIGGDLNIEKVVFEDSVQLTSLSVGASFDLRDTELKELDLTNARVKRELRLVEINSKNITWIGYAPKFSLLNTNVDTVQASKDAWPPNLELDGFTYKHFAHNSIAKETKKSEWFIKWLGKDKTYSPQPYLHLASVLRASGHEAVADKILFNSREKQRENSEMWEWLRLTALRFTIGYGYGWGYFQALAWLLGLVLLGMIILIISLENQNKISGFWNSAFYSLDMLLPVIRLRDLHYEEIDLVSWARYYFYLHKILGYILVFFVLAGLSGLTE